MMKNLFLFVLLASICSSCSDETIPHWFPVPKEATEVRIIHQSDMALDVVHYQIVTKKLDKRNFEYIKGVLLADEYELCRGQEQDWHLYATIEGGGGEIKGDRLLAYFLKSDMSYSVSLSVFEMCDRSACKQHLNVSRKKIRHTSDNDAFSLRKFCDTGEW